MNCTQEDNIDSFVPQNIQINLFKNYNQGENIFRKKVQYLFWRQEGTEWREFGRTHFHAVKRSQNFLQMNNKGTHWRMQQ